MDDGRARAPEDDHMPKGPAARIGDMTAHGSPLAPGLPSKDVMIGKQPAWLGLTAAGLAVLTKVIEEGVKKIAEAAEKVTKAAALGPPAQAAAAANLVDVTAQVAMDTAAAMTSLVAGGVSQHACPVVKVAIPDGIGLVINPSSTVIINGWGACRLGDTIQEVSSVNTIAAPCCATVIIGG